MNCVSTLDINTGASLKVKRRTLVVTSCGASLNSRKQIRKDVQVFAHPIAVQEAVDLEAESKLAEVPKTSENTESFQHGPTNGKLLKCYFS